MTPQQQRETDEETRLARIYEAAQEALRSASEQRYDPSYSEDENYDRRAALDEAQGRVDEGWAELVRFWNIPNDAVMLEYLERPIGQREGWLETELKKHRARIEAEGGTDGDQRQLPK